TTLFRSDFEMAATEEMLDICLDVQPHFVMLVPERREELTTEGGLNMDAVFDDFQQRVFPRLNDRPIGKGLFVDPNEGDIKKAAELGSDLIELHTGTYSNAVDEEDRQHELKRLKRGAELA